MRRQGIIGFSFIGEKHRGVQPCVVRPEILDLLRDLGVYGQGQVVAESVHRLLLRQGQPALIYDGLVFLFQLDENRVLPRCRLVAANAQLLFIGRLFQRAPDQPKAACVIVNVPNHGTPIAVQLHIGFHHLQDPFLLLGCKQVFDLIALECCLIGHGN